MTDQTRIFQLERLYLAAASTEGQTPGLQLLARTPGVRPEHIAECRRAANLLPPPPAQRTSAMPSTIGLFRSESVDYILAKAQAGPQDLPQFQYLLLPAAAIRWLGGNLRLFESWAMEPIPNFPTQRLDLPPFVLENPEPPDAETQTDDLLALIGFTRNKLKVIEGLLAGLIQAMGIGIINAPLSLHDRIGFVQGLMSLLPIPARIAMTFATSVIAPAQTNTQIKFLASDVRPARHIIFDWAANKLLTEAPEDVYTKFIMAQLRLDTSFVVQQTEALARTAVWRATRKDDMANALGWASRRASVDVALQNGQPVDRAMVAAILREDPTLPDDLRVVYSRHLLSMSLAMDDPTLTDIIPTMAVQNREVGDAVYEQLKTAAEGEQASQVYRLVERWITQAPAGTDVNRWRPLLGTVILRQTNELLQGQSAPLVQFMEQFLEAPPALQLEPIIAQVIGLTRKRGYDDPDIARAVFLLAVTYLPPGGLQRLMGEAPLVSQLPEALRAVFVHLVPEFNAPAPLALLARGAEVFGPAHQQIILARLVEWALYIQRADLIDLDALRGMVRVAVSPLGARFDNVIQHIVEELSRVNVLRALDSKTPQYLVELSIARGRYAEAVHQLEFFQNTFYKGTRHEDLAEIVLQMFCDVPFEVSQINEMLQAMQDSQLRPLARANAYVGALESKHWGPEMEMAAHRLTDILYKDPRFVELIGLDPTLQLLKANSARRDEVETLRLTGALVEYALLLADKGKELINRIYPMINWSTDVNDVALEMLRTYVRRAPIEVARELPHDLGARHGEKVERSLDAAYRLRLVVGGADFMRFRDMVHAAAPLLIDMAAAYHPSQELPPIHKLRRTAEAMPGGLSEADCKRLSDNLNTIGLQILKLAQLANRKRPASDPENYQAHLLKGTVPPTTGLDALRWIGGRLSEGQAQTLDLTREAAPHLLGNRSVNILLRETDATVHLFDGLLAAFPEKDPFIVDNAAWSAEVDSLWAALGLYKQRQIQAQLAQEAQLLAQVVKHIGEKGHERSFQSSGYGRQLLTGRAQPRSVIDALRWLSGYFGRQHDG